mmetsp:Transcript_11269/g.16610  ORF Transcript_11269/g.16610 Transcript_11269/m.16610 type:complete len:271 (+) Transcript_11269:142-954(+)
MAHSGSGIWVLLVVRVVVPYDPVWGHLLHLHPRSTLQTPQHLQNVHLASLQVLSRVGVVHIGGHQVKVVVRAKVLVVVVHRDLVVDFLVQQHSSLVGPAPGHVADGVAPAPQHQHRHVELLHVLHALRVTLEGEVEAAQAVPCDGVCPALQDDGTGPVALHHLGHDRSEYSLVGLVGHALLQWEVHRVVLPSPRPHVLQVPSAWEEVPVLVEGHRHHPVRAVESLLHPISVMDINVHVQHPRVVLEQLQYGQHNVVYVAEAGGLLLLGVV